MKYSELLSKYVKDSKLSLSEISKRMADRGMKIDKSYISKLQNAAANPPSTEITIALAEVLGGDVEQLAWAAMIDKNDPETFEKLMQINKSLIKKKIELELKYPVPDGLTEMETDEYLDGIEEYRDFFQDLNNELERLLPGAPDVQEKLQAIRVYLSELKQNLWDEFIVSNSQHMGEITSGDNRFSVRKGIPLLGTICAGDGLLAEQNIEDFIYYPLPSKREPDFALRVKGDSMIGAGIEDGDIVFLREAQWAEFNGQVVAALINDDVDATLKRMKWSEGAPTIHLIPENDDYTTIEALPNQIKVCGVYMGHFKSEKGDKLQ